MTSTFFVVICLLFFIDRTICTVLLDAAKFDADVLPLYQALSREYDSVDEIDKYLKSIAELNTLVRKLFGKNGTISHDTPASFNAYVKKLALAPSKPMEQPYLYQGDIMLSSEQLDIIIQETKRELRQNDAGHFNRRKRTFSALTAKWNDLPISYYIDNNVDRYAVTAGIKIWTDNTCLTFKEGKNARHALMFYSGRGCSSAIGMQASRTQLISIGFGCNYPGLVAHEIGHALGLFHEQARYDRDNYININSNNIEQDMEHNFVREPQWALQTFNISYDHGSVMHYDAFGFARDKRYRVITTKDPNYSDTIGQRLSVAFSDFKKINLAYCMNNCEEKLECQNGGYGCVGKGCLCSEGFGGKFCEELLPSPHTCGQTTLTAIPTIESLTQKGKSTCYYLIMAPVGHKIKLTVENINFVNAVPCERDYLEIKYNDDFAVVGTRFCGRVYQKSIESARDKVLVIFKGYHPSNYFTINYSSVAEGSTVAPVTTTSWQRQTTIRKPPMVPLFPRTTTQTTTIETVKPSGTTQWPGTRPPFTSTTPRWTLITAPQKPRTTLMTTVSTTTASTTASTLPLTTSSSPQLTTPITQPITPWTPIPFPCSQSTCPCGPYQPYPMPYPYPLPYPIPYPYPYPYPRPNPNNTLPPFNPFGIEFEELSPIDKETTEVEHLQSSQATINVTISAINATWPYNACDQLNIHGTIPYKRKNDKLVVAETLGTSLTSCIKSSMAKVGEKKFEANLLGAELSAMKHRIKLMVKIDFTNFLDAINV